MSTVAEREREELVERVRAAGASEAEIREAIAADRLALLPAEMLLRRDCRYSLAQAARITGIDREFLVAHLTSIGMVLPDDEDDAVLSDVTVDALRRLKPRLDGGISRAAVIKIDHVFNRALAQIADGIVEVILSEYLAEAASETDLALRIERATRVLRDDLIVYLGAAVEAHLRQRVAREVIGRADIQARKLPGTREVAVCFADLVGFTEFSENREPEEVSEVATAFGELATSLAEPPVRLVKLIGDAAMFVSEELDPLVECAFAVLDRAAESALPPVRIGLAHGPAVERGGDWFGSTVNLASRLTREAEAGSVTAPAEVATRLSSRYASRELEPVALKGFSVPVTRCRLEREVTPT